MTDPKIPSAEREPHWSAGAIGRIPDDDSLVFRDDAIFGKQFYASTPSEAEDAARFLNEIEARADAAEARIEELEAQAYAVEPTARGVAMMGGYPFGEAIREVADRMVRRLMRHRERYLRAWVAATGLRPDESEMVEEVHPMAEGGVIRTVVWFRPRRTEVRAVLVSSLMHLEQVLDKLGVEGEERGVAGVAVAHFFMNHPVATVVPLVVLRRR